MYPYDADTKTGQPVIDVPQGKHHGMMVPDLLDEDIAAFEAFTKLLETVPVDCDTEIVEEVPDKLMGGVGPSSADAIALKNWLLRHWRASQVLREDMAACVEWLYNESPP